MTDDQDATELLGSSPTDRARRRWDRIAPQYDRRIDFFERRLVGNGRRWACAQASGEVLEIAVGTGRNLPFYPEDLDLTAIDVSGEMLRIAGRRAEQVRSAVRLQQGDAQALDFGDESFDTVVCTLSLCSIPDDAKAVREMKRVLRPGGRVILVEHVASPSPPVRALQWLIDLVTVPLLGDHQRREPLRHLLAEGFELERSVRRRWGVIHRIVALKPPIPGGA